jgi:hypothetical protein
MRPRPTRAEASGGDFRPEACHEKMLQKHPEDWDAPYRVQLIHGSRLYRFEARNFGDWYDVERVALACNRALADAGTERRFFQTEAIDQGATFVCLTPEQAMLLEKEFHVSFEEDLEAAMRLGKEYEERALKRLESR